MLIKPTLSFEPNLKLGLMPLIPLFMVIHIFMKAKLLSAFIFPTMLLLFTGTGCSTSQQKDVSTSNQLKAGMAEIDITPPVGYRMAGYYDERFSTGIHDPLKAKALVLQQGNEKIALVFCDLVGLSLHVTTNARAAASKLTGIPVTNIVVAATHSHTGPLFDDVRRNYFNKCAIEKYGKDPHEKIYYPDFLSDRIAKVVARANANLSVAEVDAGIGTQPDLPFNRRYYMKNGRVAFNPGQLNTNIVAPAGPVDHDVGILMVKKNHQSIGGLTVFAMHADTMGSTEFSADYPFYIQQTLRNAFGPKYISAFGAGTCGDLNQVNVSVKEPFKGPEVTEKLGTKIGATVLSTQKDLQPIQPALAGRSKTLMLPLQEINPKDLEDAKKNIAHLADDSVDFYTKVRAVKALDLQERGTNFWPMEIQTFRLDNNTAIVCLPAEIFAEFGLAIKKASPFKTTLVISICNDRPCYMPTEKAFREGSYETVNSRLKPGSGEAMVETALKLLGELKE
jgi:neutral ceramidase